MKNLCAALTLTLLANSLSAQSPAPPVDRFDAVLDIVEKRYIHRVDRQKFEDQALRAFLQNLDPYSHYMPAEEWSLFQQELSGTFGGIGVVLEFDEKAKLPFVKYVMRNGSAREAGIQRGDRILEIDGWSAEGFNMDDFIPRLRGKAGTKVNVMFRREGSPKPVSRLLERRVVKIPSVRGVRRATNGEPDYMLDSANRVGYIHIMKVADDTAQLVEEALDLLREQKMKGLVLDLRDNAGGMLKGAVAVADLLLDEGNIVTVVGGENPKEHHATKGIATDVPIVVLISDLTKSAGEIIAGALVDNKRVTAIGQRTWGKGRIQERFPLPAGLGGVLLTTSTFQRPNGQTFDRHDADVKEKAGIAPDPGMEVVLTEKELEAWRDELSRFDGVSMLTEEEQTWKAEDGVLARGLEVLRKLIEAR